ncbi:MAG: RlmE family RNA methyltransferase [Deltaproteobacteria bacterium]|nr:RlmE family RNA methyltransferase [Deltaproteobacteria bacterium]MBW2253592.1 RlmE family RNA methyltransferase [Deltaproteobacteria bacterium]
MGRNRPYKGRDHFARRAREEGYEARSVYKLEEIQRRFGLLRQNQRVVDLGCYPGSWSRYAMKCIGPRGRIVGVDLQEPSLAGGTWIVRSVYDVTPEELLKALGGPADVVLSDMAPLTTGDRFGDHIAQLELARRALELARVVLVPGGALVAKVFEGGEAGDFQAEVKTSFARVKRVRPPAVRKQSREWFVVARGFRA